MPTYEYECKECRHTFEVFQRVTDDPVSICEKCGGTVRKILFPVGIVFKGSGFHVTDYRKPEKGGNGNGKKSQDDTEKPADSPKKEPISDK